MTLKIQDTIIFDIFMTSYGVFFVCHVAITKTNKTTKTTNFAFQMTLTNEKHSMTAVISKYKFFIMIRQVKHYQQFVL